MPLEGAEAGYATATGMAAVFATFAGLLGVGDHIGRARDLRIDDTILTKIIPSIWDHAQPGTSLTD
ncbi:MAG: hypothetical protein IPG88_16530 [Gemmatimonadetes bacterium]|nr:hypothetical protein [Gemmatimonadota bacterium]